MLQLKVFPEAMPRTPMFRRGYSAHTKTPPLGTPALHASSASLGASVVPQCLLAVEATAEDRATASGDLHTKFREDRSNRSRDMLADRQTDRRADHNTPHPYLAE